MVRKKKTKHSAFEADRNQKIWGISNFRNKLGFPKWWVSPTTHRFFPTKSDYFGVWNGGKPTIFQETPKYRDALLNVFIFFSTTPLGIPNGFIRFFFVPKKFRSASCRCATRTASWLHNVESPWDGQQMWRNHWWLWPVFPMGKDGFSGARKFKEGAKIGIKRWCFWKMEEIIL